MADPPWRGLALPGGRGAHDPGPGSGGVRPARHHRGRGVTVVGVVGRATRAGAPGVGAMRRRAWLLLATAGAGLARPPWAGARPGGARALLVPLFPGPVGGG